MLSDHGFELLDKHVNINYFLQERSLLKLKDESNKNFSDIDFGTKAFALDPARIYINRKGKYPRGSVSPRKVKKVINKLIDLFDSLQIDGKKAFKKVYRRDEIYRGPFINHAPDLVLLGEAGFNLKANIKAKNLWEKDIFTGKHTQPDAFLLVKGMFNKNIVPDSPCVTDVVEVIDRIRES